MRSRLRKSSHAVYITWYHLVWIPKYRRKLLTRPIQRRLREILEGIADRYGFPLDTLSVQGDHVHLFVSLPPIHSIADAVQIFKGISSHRLRQEFPEIDEQLWGADLWAPGYYVSTVNDRTTTQQIRRYIENQEWSKNQLTLF